MTCTNTHIAAVLLGTSIVASAVSAKADDLSDTAARLALIEDAAQKICGSVEAHGDSAEASADASFALKFLNTHLGLAADADRYNGVLRADAASAIAKAEDCRAHIVDKLLAILFTSAYSPPVDVAPPPPPPPPPPQRVIQVCPQHSDGDKFFAISTDGTPNNVSGYYAEDYCKTFVVAPNQDAVYIAEFIRGVDLCGPQIFAGASQFGDHTPPSGGTVRLPICASKYVCGDLDNNPYLWGWRDLQPFTVKEGSWSQHCNVDMPSRTFDRVYIGSTTENFSVKSTDGK